MSRNSGTRFWITALGQQYWTRRVGGQERSSRLAEGPQRSWRNRLLISSRNRRSSGVRLPRRFSLILSSTRSTSALTACSAERRGAGALYSARRPLPGGGGRTPHAGGGLGGPPRRGGPT